jgi:hypothetical protein
VKDPLVLDGYAAMLKKPKMGEGKYTRKLINEILADSGKKTAFEAELEKPRWPISNETHPQCCDLISQAYLDNHCDHFIDFFTSIGMTPDAPCVEQKKWVITARRNDLPKEKFLPYRLWLKSRLGL